MLIVTGIVASILALLYVKLTFNVIGQRRQHKVGLGDGGHESLNRAIRAHGNLAEFAPIGLILIACFEYNHAPYFLTVPLAILFLAGRILHPMGMKDGNISWSPRVKGMKLTLISLIGLSICNIVWISMIIFGYSMA